MVRQVAPPNRRRWIWTGTLLAQAENPSLTVTVPRTRRWRRRCRETVRECAVPVTVKFVPLVSVPEGVVTEIFPVVAPEGTVAVIFVSELTMNVAVVPLNFTAVAPENPVPLIVTEVPTGPLVGENDEIAGTAAHEAGATAMVAATSVATTALLRSMGVRGSDIARLLVTGGQPACDRIMAYAHDRRYPLRGSRVEPERVDCRARPHPARVVAS